MNYRLPVLLLLPLGACLPAVGDEPRTLTIEDLGRIEYVGEPVVSRDGRHVAYTLEDQIYVVSSADGEPRPVTAKSSTAYDPYWSKDGNALYFISNRSGTNQVWKLPLQSFGEAMPVTEAEREVTSLDLSSDESRLLLSFDDESKAEQAKDRNEDGKDQEKEPWVINRLQFKEDAGDGYLTEPPSDHLYTLEPGTGEPRQITAGRYAESEAAWSPDGTEIVSARLDRPRPGFRPGHL